MQFVYLLVVGIALYIFSDWLLGRIEQSLGRTLDQRSLIFFAILLTSALCCFALIRLFAGP